MNKPMKGLSSTALRKLMEIIGGNVSKAAKLAGKYRADLYELLKKHALNPKDFRKSE